MLYVDSSFGRIRKVVAASGLALGLLVLFLMLNGRPLISQENEVTEIGVGIAGSSVYQFAGRIDQEAFEFTGYGYLYDIKGIEPETLFDDPFNTSAADAHFTYYATASMTSRAIMTDTLRGIFALDSVGEITFYYHETPGADFDDPATFAAGTPIATASLRFQDILNVQSANRGIAIGNGEFTILTSESFTFEGETLRFARPGVVHRISTFGEGVRTDPILPSSTVLLAGDAVDTGFRQTFMPTVTSAE